MRPGKAGRLVGAMIISLVASANGTAMPAMGQTILHDPDQATTAPDPDSDPNKVVVKDVAAWHHPTKMVFAKYKMRLTQVALIHDRKYPIFHVADFHADPRSGMTNAFFNKFNLELLEANGYNAFTVVEDNYHDGYRISYDKSDRTMKSDLVLDYND